MTTTVIKLNIFITLRVLIYFLLLFKTDIGNYKPLSRQKARVSGPTYMKLWHAPYVSRHLMPPPPAVIFFISFEETAELATSSYQSCTLHSYGDKNWEWSTETPWWWDDVIISKRKMMNYRRVLVFCLLSHCVSGKYKTEHFVL